MYMNGYFGFWLTKMYLKTFFSLKIVFLKYSANPIVLKKAIINIFCKTDSLVLIKNVYLTRHGMLELICDYSVILV